MPRWFLPLLLAAAVGLIASVGALLLVGLPPRSGSLNRAALEPDPGLEVLKFPPFTLTSHRGEAVTESLLEGQLTILDFTFTHCPFACPGMNAEMLRMQSALAGLPVQFISITVDPLRDTPEVLAQHAATLGDEPRWTFLTGDASMVQAIVTEHLMFDLREDESNPITLPDGSAMSNIVHPTRFFLVGPERQIVTLASYTSPAEVDRLVQRARDALAEVSKR